MEITITIDVESALQQLDGIKENLDWNNLSYILDQDLREGLESMVQLAKEWCPVDTGRLRETIRFEGGPFTYHFIADPKNPKTGKGYAIFPEMGTSKQIEQPYMRPAVDSVMPEILERMFVDIRTLIRGGLTKIYRILGVV